MAYSNVTDDKAYAFCSNIYGPIIIRNGNKVFAKADSDLTWLNNVKSQINGECDVITVCNDNNKI